MIGIKTAFGFAAAGALAAAIVTHAPVAHADGNLSNREAAYVLAYGAGAVCPTIDDFPSIAGVVGVVKGIAADGFTYDDAVDIVNASVGSYCPRHWSLLQQVGAYFRGETGRQAA
ncbi:hypothetical protein A5784_34915 [Mycobacterium sp. 852013-50091_SCH5140682]|uniref:hypothetical protein n=1 Tax=Mycobacterium sp. 852013-50091_SCH5140682 TaxID=1834109 RepID=UPI0007EB3B45|nr:hypothetical protein [Mycobacterium sp. 852013-50091_SCH5140682]OBC11392.1 hypothetical protein A5784_34915 [Mycobacterium sp. 852013-50091_SCH5140682]